MRRIARLGYPSPYGRFAYRSSESTPAADWLAWARMEVPACMRIWSLVNCTVS